MINSKAFLRKENIVPEGYIVIESVILGYKAMEDPSPAPRKEGTVTIIK